jgi:predicted RNase H-like nuclease (RuvC/YqgF family)
MELAEQTEEKLLIHKEKIRNIESKMKKGWKEVKRL